MNVSKFTEKQEKDCTDFEKDATMSIRKAKPTLGKRGTDGLRPGSGAGPDGSTAGACRRDPRLLKNQFERGTQT